MPCNGSWKDFIIFFGKKYQKHNQNRNQKEKDQEKFEKIAKKQNSKIHIFATR